MCRRCTRLCAPLEDAQHDRDLVRDPSFSTVKQTDKARDAIVGVLSPPFAT